MRAFGLVTAAVAAVAVFVVGGRDGGEQWQVPGLVLIGVLVIILYVATARRAAVRDVRAADLHQDPLGHRNPHHLADPSLAEQHRTHDGVRVDDVGGGHIVIPASSFPDAGHAHGPVLAVGDDRPPPLHQVLAPPVAAPTAAAPSTAAVPPPLPPGMIPPSPPTQPHPDLNRIDAGRIGPTGVEPILVDLRADSDDPMVMRQIVGDAPSPGSRSDVSAPAVDPFEPPSVGA